MLDAGGILADVSGKERQPGRGAELSVTESDVTLVAFVPFLTRGAATVVSDLPAPGSLPDAGSTHPLEEMLDDLRLWGYSEDVNARLREHLPHRVFRQAVPDVAAAPFGADGCVWREELRRLEQWSIDVGLITLVYRLECNSCVTWSQVRGSAASRERKRAILAEVAGLVPLLESKRVEHTTPLWVQEVFVVEARSLAAFSALDQVADEVSNHGTRLQPLGKSKRYAVRLGTEVCIAGNLGERVVRDALGRVVAAQTAVWAGAIDFDLLLGGLLKTQASGVRRLPLEQVQSQLLELLDVFERVQRFRANIDVIPLHLNAPDRQLWECINSEWDLGQQLASLDTKLSAVEHVYGHLANTMLANRSNFLNKVVLAITMLSFATFWLTVWEFTRKVFSPFDWSSAAVASAAILLAGASFYGVGWWSSHHATGVLQERLRAKLSEPRRPDHR